MSGPLAWIVGGLLLLAVQVFAAVSHMQWMDNGSKHDRWSYAIGLLAAACAILGALCWRVA